MSEAQAVKGRLFEITNARFEVAGPVDNYPPGARLNWVLRVLDAAYVKVSPHVTMVWADDEGKIHLESFELGSTFDWVEQQYGEKGLVKLADFNLDLFETAETRERLGKSFPNVLRRLEECEKILAEMSSKTGVELKLVKEQIDHLVLFRIAALVDGKGLDTESELKMVEAAVGALEEGYDAISEYEAERM